jgi:peptidyl-prolyl cis-trans isomerase SurA
MIRNLASLICVALMCAAIGDVRAQSKAKKQEASPVLFTINKKPVLADEIIYLYRKPNQTKPEEYTEQKIEEYIDLYIKFKLKVEEAKNRGMDTTASFRKEYNSYREELRKPYLPDNKLIDSLTELTYSRLKEEVKASHILINVKPDATPDDTLKAFNRIMEIRQRVMQEKNFNQVAFEVSEDPTAKMNQGNLGYFTAMQMVFPFEQTAYNTPVGQISKPIRSSFGYHIIYVADRKPARGEVEVAHIMIRTGQNQDNEKARNLIFEAHDKLQKGVAWEELVKEYTDEPSAKENGGKLRPFGVGAMIQVPQFEETAFNLKSPGDFSDPFQTQYGWHIIKLISKIPLPPFAELAPTLKNRVSRDERAQISRQAIQEKMRREFGFKEHADVKQNVLTLADSSLQKAKWQPPANLSGQILFEMEDRSYPVKDFFTYVIQNQKGNNQDPKKYLEQLYTKYVEEVQGLVFEERIKQKNPDYAWLLKEYYEGILLFEIMEKESWSKGTEDTVGQLKYYEANRTKYHAGERVQAKLYSSQSLTVMDQLKKSLEEGDTVKMVEWIKREKVRQESGNFEKTERPVLSKVTWSPGIYRTENNGLHYLVWIRKILPPGNRTFAEARALVISDYQKHLEDEWLNQLRKKYPVKMNKKGKQYLMGQLLKK